ncbi:uncharacterized protein LOC131144750 [Malania oleifera]|uniref:uncharacterized protein LOC131144750 n=1 Tax=Malania oleifera TaxID=397392 RepID=UPI0025AE625F|nr:uncharacterized protein LOC131144750 [Malania oleifera]
MQTKKRVSGRNSSRDHASPRVSRSQRKVSEIVQVAEKKVADIITSSARKQKSAGTFPKKIEDPIAATNLNARCGLQQDKISHACLGYDAYNGASLDCKSCSKETANRELETIFSPAFLKSRSVGGEIVNGVDFSKFFHGGDHKFHQDCEPGHSEVNEKKNSESINSEVLNEEKNSSIKASCPGNMEVDIDISSKTSSANCAGQLLSSYTNAQNFPCDVDFGADLPSGVSAIYLAMKNSKLECIDEHDQDPMSTNVHVDEEDFEEFDDFDPYLFIKNLPDLSSVVPTFRRMLLPKQTRSCPPISLVLDLDETLVHSSLEPCDDADFTFPVNFNLVEQTVYVRCRPHLRDFMDKVAGLFEIIIFTASQSIYAEQLLNVLDPKRKVFRHRVYRESCVYVEGNYLKDLSVLGRDLARVVIIDNSPQAFGFQVDNGIPIESWFDDRSDQELKLLLPFLESLVGVEDVRPLIAKKFNLQEKVAAAVHPTSNLKNGDPLERIKR